jgi:hypothetical protein
MFCRQCGAQRRKGCGERGGSPCPRPALERPGARSALRIAVDWIDQRYGVWTKPLARRTLRVRRTEQW